MELLAKNGVSVDIFEPHFHHRGVTINVHLPKELKTSVGRVIGGGGSLLEYYLGAERIV